MQFTRIISTALFLFMTQQVMAQNSVALDPTGKRFMKPKERTKFGGPSHNVHSIPAGKDSVNITFVEIQLDPAAKGGLDVSVRGTKTPKVRGCDYCNVAGRIVVNKGAEKELASISNDEGTKEKQLKNGGAARLVSFKNKENQEFSVVSGPEGGFMFSTLPNGVYSISVGGKKVVTDFILKAIEPSPEDLKREQEMINARKSRTPEGSKEETEK